MNDINPIKSVIQTPVLSPNQILILWLIAGLILIATVAFLAYFFWWKKRKIEVAEEVKEEVIEPDYQGIALERLKQTKKLIADENYKTYYLEITEIVKYYIDGINKLNTTDLTTKEVLSHPKLDNDTKKKLKDFFHTIDLAKFADRNLDKEHAEEIFEIATNIIKPLSSWGSKN